MSHQFFILLITQFIVGIADNALIIVVIAQLQEQSFPNWWIPILKVVFTVAYVLFAPFVGHISDISPKRRVMLGATILKIVACLFLLFNIHPFICLLIAGLGASVYSPAKYGLATEMVDLSKLVKANAWLEVSTVLASIFGFLVGGYLVSDFVRGSSVSLKMEDLLLTHSSLQLSISVLLMLLAFASVLTLYLPISGFLKPKDQHSSSDLLKEFQQSLILFWRDDSGRVSLCVTTLFWGVGATMQLLILVWAQEKLGFSLSQASYFQISGALGMVIGAVIAASTINVSGAIKLTKLGIIIGLMMLAMTLVNDMWVASFLMATVGLVCALLVVPFNALLQHRGKEILFPGQSIAVQNFCENTSVLLLSLAYSFLLAMGLSLNQLLSFFGIFIVLIILLIIFFNQNVITTETEQ
ncbi:MAG: lysophospholipid transporter LplT [Betaproteobacteria bacterium]